MLYFIDCLKFKRADCFGRARRKEYWGYTLMLLLVAVVIAVIGVASVIATGGSADDFDKVMKDFHYSSLNVGLVTVILYFFQMIVAVPSLAVSVRRLHDTGRSGRWVLLEFLPFIGWLWLFILYLLPGQEFANVYGENPRIAPYQKGKYKTDFQCLNACLTKYADFSGRSDMQEYWGFLILSGEVGGFAAAIGGLFDFAFGRADTLCAGIMGGLAALAFLIPWLASTVRRIRSAGHSPWKILLLLLPVVGWIWVFVLTVLPETEPEAKRI
ncbi:MAG: DUF805 domain-containing protein [Abditibacteriota bacterium]|nr:DUF805 domain-containing protein [Abditibacteriota bacterium]